MVLKNKIKLNYLKSMRYLIKTKADLKVKETDFIFLDYYNQLLNSIFIKDSLYINKIYGS